MQSSTKPFRSLRFSIIATVMGNTLEWYDAALFGLLAPLFSQLFFSKDSILLSVAHPFFFYAIAALSRPLGGIAFGYYGDRFGRKAILVKTISLMLVPVVLITFLPEYSTIGIFSTIFLVIICIIQGFSAGGEFSSSIVFLTESAPEDLRGFAGSWSYFGILLGMLISSLDFISLKREMPDADFLAWGWKLPYYMGIVLGIIGLSLRFLLHETPEFNRLQEMEKDVRAPLMEALKRHPQKLLLGFFAFVFDAIGFNTIIVYTNSYLTHVLKFQFIEAFTITIVGLLTGVITVPLVSKLGMKYGYQKKAKAFLILAIFAIFPLYWLMGEGAFFKALIAQIALVFILAGYLSNLPALVYELFPTEIRLTSAALVINFSVAILGGSAPLLMVYLIEQSGFTYWPAIYLIVGACMSYGAFHAIGIHLKKKSP